MPYSAQFFRILQGLDPSLREALLALLEEIERQREIAASREDIQELKEALKDLSKAQEKAWQAIRELTEAQRRTEERVGKLEEGQARLEKALAELAEAQRRTEERVGKLEEGQARLEKALAELAEAQKRTEEELKEFKEETRRGFEEVWQAIRELTEAQRRTEERVGKLEEGQARLEKALAELAEAQRRTEEELRKLTADHRKTREILGGLQHTVGYLLEDRAYAHLPRLLKEDFKVEVLEPLRRRFIEIAPNRYEELNIIGKGRKNGKEIWILGECKSQLKKRDVDTFLSRIKRLEKYLPGEKLLLLVTYQTSPQVERYVEEKGLKLYYSYQFPM